MTNIINIDVARSRIAKRPQNPIVQALDALALALTDHDHIWSDQEVSLYETAIAYCGCTGSGSSA